MMAMINTPRMRLRCWEHADREAFAAMRADPEVMHDYGGPISRSESDAKLNRYAATYRQYGFCRWAVESRQGAFLGYVGIMPSRPNHPIGSHVEIGWRLMRHAWGHGYATEAARAALNDAFARIGLAEVIAYARPGMQDTRPREKLVGQFRHPLPDHVGPLAAPAELPVP